MQSVLFSFFFFNDTATTEIYTLSLHDALPIYHYESADPRQSETVSGRRRAAIPNRSIPRDVILECARDSSESLELVAAASCSAASPCHLRVAWPWAPHRRECARLPPPSRVREMQTVADASWREHLLFRGARFLALDLVHGVAVAALPRRKIGRAHV